MKIKKQALFAKKEVVRYGCAFSSTPNYNRINEWPLQFLRTGYYRRSYGYLDARTTRGHWWSGSAGSATYGRYLGTDTGYVNAQRNGWRGHGFALRCVATCNGVTSWGCGQ